MPRGVKRKDPAERPALARGLPEKFVDCLLDVIGCDEDEITVDSTLMADLGADSLDVVELGIHCEEYFNLGNGAVNDRITERWAAGSVGEVLADLRLLGARI